MAQCSVSESTLFLIFSSLWQLSYLKKNDSTSYWIQLIMFGIHTSGCNIRFEHCFADEDSMQWLKRNLAFSFEPCWTNASSLQHSYHACDMCAFVCACSVSLGVVLRAHQNKAKQRKWCIQLARLRHGCAAMLISATINDSFLFHGRLFSMQWRVKSLLDCSTRTGVKHTCQPKLMTWVIRL